MLRSRPPFAIAPLQTDKLTDRRRHISPLRSRNRVLTGASGVERLASATASKHDATQPAHVNTANVKSCQILCRTATSMTPKPRAPALRSLVWQINMRRRRSRGPGGSGRPGESSAKAGPAGPARGTHRRVWRALEGLTYGLAGYIKQPRPRFLPLDACRLACVGQPSMVRF